MTNEGSRQREGDYGCAYGSGWVASDCMWYGYKESLYDWMWPWEGQGMEVGTWGHEGSVDILREWQR